MYITADLGTFVQKNHNDILTILKSKGFFDPYVAADLAQDLYLTLAQYKSLEHFDPAKGSFARYIYVILDRVIVRFNRLNRLMELSREIDPYKPADVGVGEQVDDFLRFCRHAHIPRLDEIHQQLRARARGEFLDGPSRYHYLRVRARFLREASE